MAALLLIHRSFPGQFLGLVPFFLQAGHSVDAIGADALPEQLLLQWQIAGQEFRFHHCQAGCDPASSDSFVDPDFEACLRRAEQVADQALTLRNQGYQPDLVLVHSGWGEALHLRAIWPEARLVVYPEIYGSPHCLGYGYDPALPTIDSALMRCIDRQNLLAIGAMAQADAIVVPTRGQLLTFPVAFQPTISRIYEGVDLQRACPDPKACFELPDGQRLHAGAPVLTYASRCLEPLRGFSTFMRSLPALLKAHDQLQVVIAGEANPFGYGQISLHPAGHAGTWTEALFDDLDPARVHFVGRLTHADLLCLFQVSAVHVHLSYPYTLSWSALEAMACGAVVVGSWGSPLDEVISDGENGVLVDFHQSDALSGAVLRLMLDPMERQRLALGARQTLLARYSASDAALDYLRLFDRLLKPASID
jgi:glycosyltransferase involved in cell wall biosynthesis